MKNDDELEKKNKRRKYKKTFYCEFAGECKKQRPCFDPVDGDDCPYFYPTKDWTNIRGRQVPIDDRS